MATPEAKVKQKIKAVLESYRQHGILYYYMSVPYGYGKPTLDYLGFIYGQGFAIEAKAPGKKPSARQVSTIQEIRNSGAVVFVVDSIEALADFNDWCQRIIRKTTGVEYE